MTAPAVELSRAPGGIALRVGAACAVLRPRPVLIAVAGALLAACAAVVSLMLGDLRLTPLEVLSGVAGHGDPALAFVVQDVRLPRVLLALLAGAAFGLAGGVLQSVTGNSLASPDLLGVAAGAGAAAVLCIVIGLDGTGWSLSAFALAGGVLCALIVFGLSWRRGISGTRLLLIGIGMAAAGNAVTSLLIARADYGDAARATAWLVGDLAGREWADVKRVGVGLLVAGPLVLLRGRSLRLLRLGDDVARALGVRVNPARAQLLLLAVVLTATATAAAGPIAFVGLLAPLVAARLARTSETPLTASATVGALLVVTADLLARTGPLGLSLPVGAVTAVFGGLALLVLLHRSA